MWNYDIDLLEQGGTICLPSPEKPAAISTIDINSKTFVRVASDVSRTTKITRLIRLQDVCAVHEGPFQMTSGAKTPWICGEAAKNLLKAKEFEGFVAVNKSAQVLIHTERAMSAAESLADAELSGPIYGEMGQTCDDNCPD